MTPSRAVDTLVWLGDGNVGGLVPHHEALLSVFDHGFTVGDGVFETLKVTPAGVFALDRHLDRLCRSCEYMGIAMPNIALVRDGVDEVLFANREVVGELGRLRITVTTGSGPLGSERSAHGSSVVIAVAPQTPWPATGRLITVPWRRNEHGALTSVKSTSYAENVVALSHAHQHGGDEGIFINTAGHICEGTGSNIFWVADGVVFTPSLSTGCLPGITRELVNLWHDVVEVEAPLAQARDAEEVFITSSTRDIQPITSWDDHRWSTVGPVTLRIQQKFIAMSSESPNP
jgi:branched-chain amino acid aminotransferase